MSFIDAARMCSHLTFGLPAFLAHSPDKAAGHAEIEHRLKLREEHFLQLAKTAVYHYPNSPYRPLFREAGCEWTDLQRLVQRNGLDSALLELLRAGVYVKFDEFKGKREVKRGGQSFGFTESDFDNPHLNQHFEVQSGGTRSTGTRTMIDLDFIAAMAVDTAVLFDVHRVWDHPQGIWLPLGGTALVALMIYSRLGRSPLKWFSQIEGRAARLSFKYRMGTDLMLFYGSLFGRKLPFPEHVPVHGAAKVAAWMAEMLRTSGRACLTTFASSAVRVCLSAQKLGADFAGATFITIGEPLTAAKVKVIESMGARAIPRYAFTEAGILGYGCGAPQASDDMHLLSGNVAVIDSARFVTDNAVSVPAFYVTSLLKTAPKILINVENGDCGLIERSRCSCLFDRLGYSTHISKVRSFEKLTGEGVTFAGVDLGRIIEEVLPSRFGGHGVDYQVVEQEGDDGLPRLSLIASPTLGNIDEAEVLKCFLAELGKQTEAQKIMAEIWAQSSSLHVRRELPLATRAGKVFPFHVSLGIGPAEQQRVAER
ncbi:MAG: hypothetical protein ACREQW_02700 [Candidatus Binatia bacterium]